MIVTWTGAGSNPYLLLAPSEGSYRNVSIPVFANDNGNGAISTQIPFTKGTPFIVTMSDSNGFGSGDFSDILTVGDPVGSASCNTTDPGTAFTYGVNDALIQCSNAVQPLKVYGIVPGGGVVAIPAPLDNTGAFSWIADVAGNNSMIFIVDDAQGRQGGCSAFRPVGPSDDSTCLNSNAPSSTPNAPMAGPSFTFNSPTSLPFAFNYRPPMLPLPNRPPLPTHPPPTASATSSQSVSAGGVSTGAIIGTVLGCVLAVSF